MPIVILLLAIALQVFLTAKKLSPFLSLLIVALLSGLAFGLTPTAVLAAVEKGAGSTLGSLILIITLGAILGKILEVSGAAERIATTLIRSFGIKNIQWALSLTGFMVGLPLFYNAGFIILIPLVFTVARQTGLPLLFVGIPMAASLSTTHCFLPPHPGPAFLVKTFGADMGKTLLYGIIMAIPAVIVAGPLLGKRLGKMKAKGNPLFNEPPQQKQLPSNLSGFIIALLPVFLITLSVLVNAFSSEVNWLTTTARFIGNPNLALLIAVLMATWQFGLRRGHDMSTLLKWTNEGISGIAVILLIITAGGVFKQILTDSGTGDYIAATSRQWKMPPLFFAWTVTALLRLAIGSATVAGITAASFVAPLIQNNATSPELMVLAVGAGSVFGSHVNDSAFWMFKEFFGLTMKQTFLSWTLMESLISIIGLLMVLLLDLVV